MATVTGTNLLDSVLASTGATMSDAAKLVTSARLQEMIDAGFDTGINVALVLSAASSEIKAAVPVLGDLAIIVEEDKAEIEAAADFVLTTETDTITGTAADETIEGVNSASLSEGTLSGKDTIDGGDGTDTLKVDMQQDWAGFTTGSMNNVENVALTANTTAALTYSATGSAGVTGYTIENAPGNVTLTDLDVLATFDVSGPAATSTFTGTYKAASTVATGTQTDTQVLKVTDVGTIDTDDSDATNAKFMTVNIANVEAFDITTAGTANSLDLSGSTGVKTVTVAGVGQTEINAVGAAVTSFDASGATGNVIANLTAAGADKLTTVKSGAGDDTIEVALDDLTTTATIAGGTGDDTLKVSASGAKTLQSTMTGFETVNFTAPAAVTGAVVFSGLQVTDLTDAMITGTAGGAALGGNISFVNMGSQDFTLNTAGGVTGNTFAADNTGAAIVNMDALLDASASQVVTTNATVAGSSATFNVGEWVQAKNILTTSTTGAATLNVASKVVNSVEYSGFIAATPGTDGLITADTASSLTVVANGALTNASLQADKASTVSITAGSTGAATLYELDATEATALNLTVGSKGLDMEAAAGATDLAKVQTVSATNSGHLDFTGVNLSAAANATFTGSGSTAQLTLVDVGATTQTYSSNVTISGQKAGLVINDLSAGTGKATVDISGVTGTTTIKSLDGDGGVDLKAANISGALTVTGNITAPAGSISLDVSNTTKAFELGGATDLINAADVTGVTGIVKGDVTLTATNATAGGQAGIITGDNVTVDAANALAAVNVGDGTLNSTGDIFAKTSVTYKGATLSSLTNDADIVATNESTALTVNLSGGAGVDSFTVTGGTKQESITVAGDVGAGTQTLAVTLGNTTDATKTVTVDLSGYKGSDKATTTTTTKLGAEATNAITYKGSTMNDTITIDDTDGSTLWDGGVAKAISITDTTTTDTDNLTLTAAVGGGKDIVLTNLSVSGIEKITVDDTGTVSINASAISGQSIDFVGAAADDILILTGTDGNDVIDLSKATTSGNEVDFALTGTAGNDAIVLSAATVSDEAYTWAGGTDTISSFEVGGNDTTAVSITAAEALTSVTDLTDVNSTSLSAADAIVYKAITAATDLEAETANVLVANLAANIADTNALETALEVGGGLALTAGAAGKAMVAGDAFLVAYDDGTDSYLAAVATTAGATDTTFTAGDLTATNLVKFVGVTDVATLVAADFAAFVA